MLVPALIVSCSLQAHAGNDDPFFFSNEAALTGGAVTAITHGAGALWYNPAGLGAVTRHSLQVQAIFLSYQRRTIEDGIVVQTPDGETSQDVDASRFFFMAPSVVYTREIRPGLTAGIGLFTTRDESFSAAGGAIDVSPPEPNSAFRIRFDLDQDRYHLGGGVGWQPRKNLRFGGSLFGVYEKVSTFSGLAVAFSDATTTPVSEFQFTNDSTEKSTRLGLQANIGLQWQPAERLSVGVSLWTPLLQLSESVDSTSLTSIAVVGPGVPPDSDLIFDPQVRDETGVGAIEPWRMTVGLAWDFERGYISGEASYSPALQAFDLGTDLAGQTIYLRERDELWNLRIGGIYRLKQNLHFGAGVFTDRSAAAGDVQFPESDVDFYGFSTGVRILSPVRLAKEEPAKTIVFDTTISLRYSYGTGEAGGSFIDLPGDDLPSTVPVNVVFHEVYLYLGTGVRF
jgi:hypothetical protein